MEQYSHYIDASITIISIIVGLIGLIAARVSIGDWIRLQNESSGKLVTDDVGMNLAQQSVNKQGYPYHVKEMKKRLEQKVGKNGYDVIATPAEVDYLFAYLLAHLTNKKFCSIHTSSEWPPTLTRFRYNNIDRGDRVVLVAVVLSSGKFMVPAIDLVLEAGATVSSVISVIEARPPNETATVEKVLLAKNVSYDAIYRQFAEN